MKEVIIPEEKMKRYLKYCQGETSIVACTCGKVVEITMSPYFYDEENNDVYFASLCPECGELLISKE
jgi:hypothetical protein